MARIIGIRHRRKFSVAEGEARPTTAAIKAADGLVQTFDLETETDELDFLMARFPSKWEAVEDQDILWFDAEKAPLGLRHRHCKWKKVKPEEAVTCKANHIRQWTDEKGNEFTERLTKVPVGFDGLQKDDKVGMVLGGSGDRFAAALSRRGEEIGAEVFRIPPFSLLDNRDGAEKDNDHLTFVKLLEEKPSLFHKVTVKDREVITVKEAFRLREWAQNDRKACGQRIEQSLVGQIFLNKEGKFPEGTIEDEYDKLKANDVIFQGLETEERRRNRELARAVQGLAVWEKIFEPVEGCGERIAAALIAAIGDIRRFAVPLHWKRKMWKTRHRVKAFCGVHVMQGGKHKDVPPEKSFPRRRGGQISNWSPLARQALYLLVDQFNRRPASEWGKKLLNAKAKYRQTHPEPVEVETTANGKGKKKVKKYTDGHIHKMALWHTATKFVEWMTREWLKLEKVYES